MRENRPYGLAGGETEINRSSLPRSLFQERRTIVLNRSGPPVLFPSPTLIHWNMVFYYRPLCFG